MSPLGVEEQPIEIAPQVREAAAQAGAGDLDAALRTLAPLIDSDGHSVAARFVLAMTAWRMNRLDWALELTRSCHESAPMDGVVAEAVASLQAQVGNMVESIYAGKLATALGSDSPLGEFVPAGFPAFNVAYQAIEERPLLTRARRDLNEGRLADAIEKARQHVALNARDSEAGGFYAAAVMRAGRASDAVDHLRRLEGDGCDSGPLASLYARSLAAVGDCDAARTWHAEAQSLAPADPFIAAACVADGLWLETQEGATAAAEAWTRRFCPPSKPRAWRSPGNRLVIAYLAAKFPDPGDAAAVAAVARAHDRESVRVVGYGCGAQSWDENATLRGAFDAWQDIGTLDGATLARYIGQDEVGVVVDASGFAVPQGLQALARVSSALRVSWLGNPGALLAPIYDVRISAFPGGEADWCIDGGYPVLPSVTSAAETPRAIPQFGADVSLAQLCKETVATWSRILDALPEAKLLLRVGDAGRGNVARLVARFGNALAGRIDLVAVDRFEDFYARIDVALAPWRGASPRSAAEAVACCVPTVAIARNSTLEPYGAFLRTVHPAAALVAGGEDDYVRRAVSLARTPVKLSHAASADPVMFACEIERRARAALSQVAAP
jgi:protein O-GlcNAc transferase